jgi:hypothetical protein
MASTMPAHFHSRLTGGRAATFVRRIAIHERLIALLGATVLSAIAFAPRIQGGGLLVDDWALYSDIKFPTTQGFTSSLSALLSSAGSRVGAVPYWWAGFSILGTHTKLLMLLAAALAIPLALSVYVLLRELRFSATTSLAAMAITILAPSVETERLWFTPSGSQIALMLFFFGLTVALRAFAAPHERRLRLHICAWMLYVLSAAYAEVALPLLGVSILVYLTRAPFKRAFGRWTVDLPIVLVGYYATAAFVGEHKAFEKLPASEWGRHAHLIGEQALTIFTSTLVPFAEQPVTLVAIIVLAGATLFVWLKDRTQQSVTRRELARWAYTFFVCLAAMLAVYVTFVPAMLYYEPLGPGLADHINIPTAAPLAVGVIAVIMLARAVLRALIARAHQPRLLPLATALAAMWFSVVAVDAGKHVRHNAHIWATAASHDYHELHVLISTLTHPVDDATIYTFGEAGTVAPGMPVFFSSFELQNAIKIAYNRGDVSGFPVVKEDNTVACMPAGVTAEVGATKLNAPSPYGRSYFFDIPSRRYQLLANQVSCQRALQSFHPGPYVTGSLHWEH